MIVSHELSFSKISQSTISIFREFESCNTSFGFIIRSNRFGWPAYKRLLSVSLATMYFTHTMFESGSYLTYGSEWFASLDKVTDLSYSFHG